MKKALIIIAIIVSFGFGINYNSIDSYLNITNGKDNFEFYIENDTVWIHSELPLMIDVPNVINLDKEFDSIWDAIDKIKENGFKDGYYYIGKDSINLSEIPFESRNCIDYVPLSNSIITDTLK